MFAWRQKQKIFGFVKGNSFKICSQIKIRLKRGNYYQIDRLVFCDEEIFTNQVVGPVKFSGKVDRPMLCSSELYRIYNVFLATG